jgi:hypothetical protein
MFSQFADNHLKSRPALRHKLIPMTEIQRFLRETMEK